MLESAERRWMTIPITTRPQFSPKTSGIIRALQTNQIAPVPLGADKARQLLTVKALMKRPDGNSGEATP